MSEARELLAAEYAAEIMPKSAARLRRGEVRPGNKVTEAMALRAISTGRRQAIEECAAIARQFANKAADIALEGGDRARANDSMEAMATRIAQHIERLL